MAKVETMDYKKLSVTKMLDWLQNNNKSEEELLEFANKAYVVVDGEGKTKNSDAKKYFYNKYKGEINFENAPKEQKRMNIVDRLEEIINRNK